jgi:hypothetical protein
MKTGSKWWVLFLFALSSAAWNLASGQVNTGPSDQALIDDRGVPADDISRHDNIIFFSCLIGVLILTSIVGIVVWRKRRNAAS